MRSITVFAFFMLFEGALIAHAPDMDYVRNSYGKAVHDKNLCSRMISDLTTHQQNHAYLAYLGAFQAIWANHVFSPVSKYSTFSAGKNNIEKAIKKAPLDPEIRFIRLSVQKNIPAFLGYSNHIDEDTRFLKKHLKEISSPVLLRMIQKLL